MTGENDRCMHGILISGWCPSCVREDRIRKAAIAGAAALVYQNPESADKRKCAHEWPEKLHPCPACAMDQSVMDAMDSSKTEPRRFTGLGGAPVVEDKNIPDGKAFVIGPNPASWPDQAVEMNYQLKAERVEVTSITDKPDPKNVRGDWFNAFGGEDNGQSLRMYQESLHEQRRMALHLTQEVNKLLDTVRGRDCEIRVLRQACKAAGDEIRELKAQRKPEKHGSYWLTFPECATSRGMYLALGVLLLVAGGVLAWAVR